MTRTKTMPLCGIKALYWLDFFKVFHQDATEKEIGEALDKLKRRIKSDTTLPPRLVRDELLQVLYTLEKSWLG